jgi:hypothetical protein
MNRQESATNASLIKRTTMSPVLPQRDGMQDDYNDVYIILNLNQFILDLQNL